jgi:hypothetical protein
MYKCDHPGCKFTSEKPQGINAHQVAHLPQEEKDARVAKRLATMRDKKANGNTKAAVLKADDIFDRIEKATRILFPDPSVFYERFEEIADLRLAMFRVLQ